MDSDEEKETYAFDVFALLRDDTSNEKASEIQDTIEALAEDLAERAGYDDQSEIYSGTESTITVAYLIKFVRLNLDYLSLENSDSDTGQDVN